MWDEAGALVIGPGPEILERTGDKLQARLLAEECHVPVLPALRTPTSDLSELQKFGSSVGYPIIIKAVSVELWVLPSFILFLESSAPKRLSKPVYLLLKFVERSTLTPRF